MAGWKPTLQGVNPCYRYQFGTFAAAFRQADMDNGRVTMLRAISIFGLGGLFFLISPKLRGEVWGAFGSGVNTMDLYAPYSYIAGGLLVFFVLIVSFYRGAQAR